MIASGLLLSAISLGVLLLGWAIYPLALALLQGRRTPRPVPVAKSMDIDVIIATRDRPDIVARRIDDILQAGYHGGRLRILVAVDARGVHPLQAYAECIGDRAELLQGDQPGGKAAALNAAVRAARAPLLAFTDSQQRFHAGALDALASSLQPADIGAVTGTLEFRERSEERNVLGLFWNYEVRLRRWEADLHSVVAVTGAIYAMKRELWRPLPAGLICDDLQVPFNVVRAGLRVITNESAIATDPRVFTQAQEYSRKVRTLTGMLQFCGGNAWVLVPWQNPIWLQFLCHKLIRLATPYLVILFGAGLVPALLYLLVNYRWMQLLAVAGACGVALVLTLPRTRRIARQAAWSAWLLTAPLVACKNALTGNWNVWR